MNCKIRVGGFELPFCESIKIRRDRNTFTDTCSVTLPQNLKTINKKLFDYITIGSEITVMYGFDRNFTTEFEGFVTNVTPGINLTIDCEDEAYRWKQVLNTGAVYRQTTYRELLSSIYTGELFTTDDLIGDWVVNQNTTVVEVLDELKKVLGSVIYFKDKALYCDYERVPEKKVLFHLEKNVPSDGCQLSIQRATDKNIISYGLSPQKNGTKIERYAYYKDLEGSEIIVTKNKPAGFLNKFEVPNIDASTLESLITRRLPNLVYTGATGTIKGICPSFTHGDEAAVFSKYSDDYNGVYSIIAVDKEYSSSGIFQTATLGIKLSNYEY